MEQRNILLFIVFMYWKTVVDGTDTDDVFIFKSYNLTNAIHDCQELKGDFVGQSHIFCRNIHTNFYNKKASITVWTGNFKTYSPWISLLGCFKIKYKDDVVLERKNSLQECLDFCINQGQTVIAYNKYSSPWCQCDVRQCAFEAEHLNDCEQPVNKLTGRPNGFYIYKVSYNIQNLFPNTDTEICHAQVINTTMPWTVGIPGCSYSYGYRMSDTFDGIAYNTEKCKATGGGARVKIMYHFRNVVTNNAENATEQELLYFNQCEMVTCEFSRQNILKEGKCNDSADGFFCKIAVGTGTDITTGEIKTTHDIYTSIPITTTHVDYTPFGGLSTLSQNQTTEGDMPTIINTISTEESSSFETSTQQRETTSDDSLHSILSSESSEMSTVEVSSTPDIIATTDKNFVSSDIYSNDRTTVESSSLSEAISINEQTVTGHSSSITEPSESANEVSFVSTDLQLTTTEPRQENTSQETSTVSTSETSTKADDRSTSDHDAITTDKSSSVLSTSKHIDSSTEAGSIFELRTDSSSVTSHTTTNNVAVTHESTDSTRTHQSTKTVSNENPQSPNKTEKAIGVEVIAGASSGVAVLIVLIIIIVVVKKRHVKPQKSDTDDFLEKNRYNSYGGIPQSNDYHDITINNKSNTPFHDNNGYALVDRNFLHSNDSVGKRTSGDIHIPRPQIENRSASIYSDKSEQVSLPSEENEGFYDHIQRGEKPRHSTTENAYGCYDEDSPYDITSHSQQKRRQSNYANVQW